MGSDDRMTSPAKGTVGGSVKRILRVLLTAILLVLCFLLVMTVAYPKVKGYVPLTILSGSMEPAYPVGSQVFVEPVEGLEAAAEHVKVGATITFRLSPDDPTLVTHRVVAVSYEADGSPLYTTQGDANNIPDEDKVGLPQLLGVVRYHVPCVGYVATSMTQTDKRSLAVVLAGALFAYAAWNVALVAHQRRRRKAIERGEADLP